MNQCSSQCGHTSTDTNISLLETQSTSSFWTALRPPALQLGSDLNVHPNQPAYFCIKSCWIPESPCKSELRQLMIGGVFSSSCQRSNRATCNFCCKHHMRSQRGMHGQVRGHSRPWCCKACHTALEALGLCLAEPVLPPLARFAALSPADAAAECVADGHLVATLSGWSLHQPQCTACHVLSCALSSICTLLSDANLGVGATASSQQRSDGTTNLGCRLEGNLHTSCICTDCEI